MKMTSSISALPVINIDRAVTFYEEKLGFKCSYHDRGFAKLLRDKVELHLWASCDNSWRWRSLLLFIRPIWTGAETFLAGTASCRIEVEQIDELYTVYKQHGVLHNSKTVVTKTDWGTHEFAALDLHGNLLTFFERIEE
ncbi:VOC family protein [Mucilaginibacter terrae]|uniref:VOC family protein n=1 Tax=Mucilaginibacter terrae TaxID=1955052 RepID=UPI00363ADBCD